MTGAPIRSIEDTADWVAFHRAVESERPDALFRDPYARMLAGDRGEQIGRVFSVASLIAIRTYLYDAMILDLLRRRKIDMVVNLAAGLDTRPYRLALPASLLWVEIDLPGIMRRKTAALAAARPACAVEVIAADLSSAAIRRRIFGTLNERATSTLVLSEGLLVYLTDSSVVDLAADLSAQTTFDWWMVEVMSPLTVAYAQQNWGVVLEAAGAPMRFAPADWRRFYPRCGWRISEFRDMQRESVRLGRESPRTGIRPVLGRLARRMARTIPPFAGWAGRGESGVALLSRR